MTMITMITNTHVNVFVGSKRYRGWLRNQPLCEKSPIPLKIRQITRIFTTFRGGRDATLRLSDGLTGAHQKTLTGHTDTIWSVSISAGGQVLASGGRDGTLRLWDLAGTSAKEASGNKVSNRAADVNGDGIVNILDLVLIAANFGQTAESAADVNDDGVVNILDLVWVAGRF